MSTTALNDCFMSTRKCIHHIQCIKFTHSCRKRCPFWIVLILTTDQQICRDASSAMSTTTHLDQDSRTFKERCTIDQRKALSEKHRHKNPDHVLIICEKSSSSTLPPISKSRFSVASSCTLGQFVSVVREKLVFQEDESIFLYIADSVIVPYAATVGELYEKYADEDGFLYVKYQEESVYGC
ncbi:hypothetical protein QR680_006504 [Steinernema hermaphroditum]|uniref:Autophagy-related protein n=1 Tax=Steinernema hermaphroditum TaxID=289476 RepID=A0AA39LX90_9BILA|nr:hypothetical protein QR680_006504 [Steinernema hermaphroditum]